MHEFEAASGPFVRALSAWPFRVFSNTGGTNPPPDQKNGDSSTFSPQQNNRYGRPNTTKFIVLDRAMTGQDLTFFSISVAPVSAAWSMIEVVVWWLPSLCSFDQGEQPCVAGHEPGAAGSVQKRWTGRVLRFPLPSLLLLRIPARRCQALLDLDEKLRPGSTNPTGR